jgi:GTP cyclohydrolase I
LPFGGSATIAYFPDKRVVGVSKLSRLLEVFSRRLQIQERLTVQVTEALDRYLEPRGSACVIEATHSCMSCRGVNKRAKMVTSSLTGLFRSDPVARSEFLSLCRGK